MLTFLALESTEIRCAKSTNFPQFLSDGSITWYEPLPVQTVPDVQNPVVHMPNSIQLLKGTINASLSWNFSLSSDVSFVRVKVAFKGVTIGTAVPGQSGLLSGFGKFDFLWIPSQKATLIILNVTTAENGAYSCEVQADKGLDNFIWRSEIEVNVVGKFGKYIYYSFPSKLQL